MYEIAPEGYSEPIRACLKIAEAHEPLLFRGSPLDAHDYASILHVKKTQPHAIPGPLSADVSVFSYVAGTIRQLLAHGKICAYFLDETAKACLISDYRYWATNEGFDDLLLGYYSPAVSLKFRRILIEDVEIARLLPKVASVDMPAKARRGRKPKLNADNVRSLVFELMDLNGEFVPEDSDWNAQARLESAVRDKMPADVDLSESALRSAIVPQLAAWRRAKA